MMIKPRDIAHVEGKYGKYLMRSEVTSRCLHKIAH